MTPSDLARPVHHPRTASRLFGGEAVIISPAENRVRMLNPIGSRIWELADGSRTVGEIAAVLCEEYDVDLSVASQSVAAFVADLASKQLLTTDA